MPSLAQGYEYDIFISYRQKDNRSDQWVTNFVQALREELDATFKEPISIYFDSNPHDGLLETHDVDGSLKEKIKCLVFIPIVSRTYCDPNAFAWQKEFLAFIDFAKSDSFGLDVKLTNGNVAKRVLPVRIHEIGESDKKLFEAALGGVMRAVDFVYKSPGVNRPLKKSDDELRESGKVLYQDHINKIANAIQDVINGLLNAGDASQAGSRVESYSSPAPSSKRISRSWSSYIPRIPLYKSSISFSLLTLALVILSYYHFSESHPEPQVMRSIIAPPAGNQFVMAFGGRAELSPDGRKLAFTAKDSTGTERLWVQSLNQLDGKPLPGTEGATFPFWSPDGSYVGFFADRNLKKVAAAGGPVQVLCPAMNGRGGSWNQEGVIIFCPVIEPSPLYRIPDSGGEPTAVTELDTTKSHFSHRWPHFLPDGKHFLYCARTATATSGENDSIIMGSLDRSFNPRAVLKAGSSMAYAHGYLLYSLGNTLMAQGFDPENGTVNGNRISLANDLQYSSLSAKAAFSVSQTGILAYQRGTSISETGLTWVTRNKSTLNRINRPGFLINEIKLSRDESRLAVSLRDTKTGNIDIWIYEISRNVWTRFTFAESSQRWPIWSPDDSQIVYGSFQGQVFSLFAQAVNGSASAETLVTDRGYLTPDDWSTDGKFILYQKLSPTTGYDIWVLPMTGNRTPYPLLQTKFDEGQCAFSPDGKWVAYTSNESGSDEVYVRPFPGPGGKFQISFNGGTAPRWRKDGKEIYYNHFGTGVMMARVSIENNMVQVGEVTTPIAFTQTTGPSTGRFESTSDGQQFILSEGENEIYTPVTLVVNWQAELKQNR